MNGLIEYQLFIAIVAGLGFGYGAICLFLGKKLDESNNVGDSYGERVDFKVSIEFTKKADDLESTELHYFCDWNEEVLEDPTDALIDNQKVERRSEDDIKNPANGKTAASALRDRSNTRPIWAPGEPERRIKEAADKNWDLDEW